MVEREHPNASQWLSSFPEPFQPVLVSHYTSLGKKEFSAARCTVPNEKD